MSDNLALKNNSLVIYKNWVGLDLTSIFVSDAILGSPHLTHGLVDAALLEGTEKKKGHSRRDRLCGSKLLQEATYAYHRCKMPKHVEMTEDLKRGQSPSLKKGL